MKKFFVFTILIASLALTGCAVKKSVEVGENDQNKNKENTANENTQIANPASTYCIEQGGNSAIIKTEAGQDGICKFNDGSECDEWAFFRKECKAGDKTAEVAETVDTTNWQIYKDKKLGFEIKYPINFTLDDCSGSGTAASFDVSVSISDGIASCSNSDFRRIFVYFSNSDNVYSAPFDSYTEKEIQVNNVNSKQVRGFFEKRDKERDRNSDVYRASPQISTIDTFIPYKDGYVVVSYSESSNLFGNSNGDWNIDRDYSDIYNKILESFKFTN